KASWRSPSRTVDSPGLWPSKPLPIHKSRKLIKPESRRQLSVACLVSDIQFQSSASVGNSDPHDAGVIIVGPSLAGSLQRFQRFLSGKFASRHGDLPGLKLLAMDFDDHRSLGRREGAFPCGDFHA